MKILFVSTLCSKVFFDRLFLMSNNKLPYSIQKFNRLVANGFNRNGMSVETLTTIPTSRSIIKDIVINRGKEHENGVTYHYIPALNLPIIKNIFDFIFAFFFTIFWGIKNSKKRAIVYDILNVSVCSGSLLASKIIGIPTIAIVTDMPGLMVSTSSTSIKSKLSTEIIRQYMVSFDRYVFLTEQMNPVINRNRRPYIIMEGLVDISNKETNNSINYCTSPYRNIIYAGGLYEKYGIKMLLEAFHKLKYEDVTLSIYGTGDMEIEINEYVIMDPRIRYYGSVPNTVILQVEKEAILLVNPRPTHEAFTKYSFPSKNMEYMVSGTPVLTTRLPGMPPEYYPYVYLFDNETVDGYYEKLNELMELPVEKLRKKGTQAREFVLKYKNNIAQSKRILDLIMMQP